MACLLWIYLELCSHHWGPVWEQGVWAGGPSPGRPRWCCLPSARTPALHCQWGKWRTRDSLLLERLRTKTKKQVNTNICLVWWIYFLDCHLKNELTLIIMAVFFPLWARDRRSFRHGWRRRWHQLRITSRQPCEIKQGFILYIITHWKHCSYH